MLTKEELELYREGKSLRIIGDKVGRNPTHIRDDLIAEGLAVKMKDRSMSYVAWLTRGGLTRMDSKLDLDYEFGNSPEFDEDAEPYELVCETTEIGTTGDSDHLYHRLDMTERALIRARDELNYRRANVRGDERDIFETNSTNEYLYIARYIIL